MKKIIFSIASILVATVLFAQPKPAATKTTAPVNLTEVNVQHQRLHQPLKWVKCNPLNYQMD
ncbi:MAG: hypothetical protein IPH89_06570 [Bacteroidetes bacterium]|nr:hypothetical protein [Bacteroidota bacterium]